MRLSGKVKTKVKPPARAKPKPAHPILHYLLCKIGLAKLCYNIATYKSPPKVRQSGFEPEYHLHGSAFQERRVCPFTTGALSFFFMEIITYYGFKHNDIYGHFALD
jgi:hypothetical protein